MIYFSKNGLTENISEAIAVLQAPIFESNGKERSFTMRDDGSYCLGAMNAYDSVEYLGDGLFIVHRKIENTGRTDARADLLQKLKIAFWLTKTQFRV